MHPGRPAPTGKEVEIDRVGGIEQGGKITKQGIKPHIKSMAGMARHRYTPRKVLAGNRKILQTARHEILDLAPAGCGSHEAWSGDQGFDRLLVARKPKKEIHLITPFQGTEVDGAARLRVAGGGVLELFTGHAVPALLATLHHIAAGLDPGEEGLHQLAMAWIGGADEAVVADLPAAPQIPVALAHGIAMGLGQQARRFGGSLDFQAMFIAAGDETHALALQPLEACDRITGQGGVSAAEVSPIVDVVKGGGERVGGHQKGRQRWRTRA